MTITQILIVDDDPVVREMLPTYFDVDEFHVAAVAATATEAIDRIADTTIDLILTDVRMPDINGIRLTRLVRDRASHIPVVGITSFDSDEYVVEMLRAGASGMVLKSAPRQEIIYAVHEALAGRTHVSTTLAAKLSPYLEPVATQPRPDLSVREKEVLSLLLDGLSNADISSQLNMSVPSVKKHLSALFAKFGVDSRLKLAVEALRH